MEQAEVKYAPGMRIIVRGEEWMVKKVETNSLGNQTLYVIGLSQLVKDYESMFLVDVENDIEIVDPAKVTLVPDDSAFFRKSKVYIESQWRSKIPTDNKIHIGNKAAMDLMSYQLEPAQMALNKTRQRILIADTVGLGKTLEAGILMSELIARGKGNPICASGTDLAIYEAAGKEKLLAERANIGKIARGDIAVTGAYSLNAKYIIHTVGPVWTDGLHHEFEILEHCYRKSLQKALELKCESIAFPLISTGVYGFPKDKALQIAVSVFSQFLTENEMEIILVVFDKRSFQLSGQIVGDIDSYIDANYVREIHRKEYPLRSRRSTHVKELAEEDFNEEMLQREEDNYPLEEMTDTGMTELLMPLENISLEDQLANIGVSFHDKLFELIDEAHLDNKDVWKRANLDRKHFSKIQCDQNYHPKKKTVMALCIALQLDLEQSRDLLARADWAFSPSSKVDLIVQKAIIDKIPCAAFRGFLPKRVCLNPVCHPVVLLQKMSEGISIPHPVARRMAGCFRSYKIFRSFFRRWSNLA